MNAELVKLEVQKTADRLFVLCLQYSLRQKDASCLNEIALLSAELRALGFSPKYLARVRTLILNTEFFVAARNYYGRSLPKELQNGEN